VSDEHYALNVPVAASVLPPRPIWNVVAPEAPWCPVEWVDALEATAPGITALFGHPQQLESVGMHLRHDGWALLLAARRGRLHAHRGEHREDAGALVVYQRGWCAAVADGAGSAPYSRLGAAIAVHVVTEILRGRLAPLERPTRVDTTHVADTLRAALTEAATAVQAAMQGFADRSGCAPRALRTTLLVATQYEEQIGLVQVGDGGIIWLHDDGRTSQPLAGDAGEFSGEVAHFLPDPGALAQLQQSVFVRPAADCVGILLASDGVEDPWYPLSRHASALYQQLQDGLSPLHPTPGGVIAARHAPVLSDADPVHALVEWLAYEKRGENDDRTLCVIRREGRPWAPLAVG